MAADDGYHPPQFSEEAAWLPPWLRSSQLLLSLDGRKKDDQHLHRMGCEFLDYRQENMGDGQSTDDITKEDSRCFSCHLFLSGGDSSSVLVHSSGNVPPFHLHLSAEGISQISSGGLGNAHTVGEFKLNREIFPVPELSVFQHEVDYERNTRNRDHPANISAGGGPPPIAIGGNQGNGKKNKEKVDRHLKTIDINDAVELTIAASEALVISELTTRVSHPEFFNTTALLEVALRVKQARNDCRGDVLEAVSSNLIDEHDETDQLHDLDDNIMADAFEDVGLLCNQIVATPNDSSDGHVSTTKFQTYSCNSEQGHSPYANGIYVDTHLSEDHGRIVAQENGPRTQDFDITAIALPEKLNHASPVGPKLKQLPFQACSLNHVEPSIHFLLNLDTMDTSNIKDQMRESIKSFQKTGDVSTSAENLPKEDRNVQDHGDKKLRGRLPNLFHGETSFISESMDVPTNGNIIVRTPEPESKIIASSSSLFEDLHRIPWDENKTNTDEDIVASCDLLEMDILCSVVPCSLSDNNHGFHCPNQEGIGTEARWCLKSTTKLIGGQNTEECLPIMVDAQGGNFVASKIRDKGSMMAHKQLGSLKNYSVAVPAKSTFSSGKSFLLREPIPTVSTNENQCHSASGEETARILMEPSTETQDINEKRESWENHGKACKPSAAAESISASMEQILKHKEAPSNDVNPMVNHHADISAPIILNTGARRRFQACKTISPRKDEVRSPKISFLSEMEKSRTRNPSDEVQCRNKACVGAACSPCLSSRTHSLEEQYLPRKKVRFSEAQADVHYLPANQSQEQSSPTKNVASSEVGADIHCNNATHKINCGCQSIHVKTNRKTKDSSKSSTFRTRSNYKCLTKDLSKDGKSRMLEGLEFLLTGFSRKKKGEVETLLRRHGGLVLPEIPLPYLSLDHTDRHLPIVLSPKKVQTTKFLYGCAIKTWLLHNNWLSDSAQAGFMLPPAKYLTLPNQISERKHLRIGQLHECNSGSLFDKVGVMLFGKMSFCTKFSKIIKLGGGQVFKALHWLVKSLKNERNTVGAIVFEDEINVSRHFKHCAMEHDLYMMPASWITNSLFSGKLLPCKKDRTAPFHRIKKPTFPQPDPVDGCEGT